MNQILIQRNEEYHLKPSPYNKKNNKLMIYKIQFFIFSFIACICLIFLMFNLYYKQEKEKISKQLLSSYNITKLYADNFDVEVQQSEYNEPFVIGILKIDKISLNYPILSEISKDLLKISLCKFAGPLPNEVGNLCIAGHNYVDYKFFSRLNELEFGDIINIYDLSGNMLSYELYEKYEVNPKNLSCTNQNTNNTKIVTLLTCNNVTGNRLIAKFKESI